MTNADIQLLRDAVAEIRRVHGYDPESAPFFSAVARLLHGVSIGLEEMVENLGEEAQAMFTLHLEVARAYLGMRSQQGAQNRSRIMSQTRTMGESLADCSICKKQTCVQDGVCMWCGGGLAQETDTNPDR